MALTAHLIPRYAPVFGEANSQFQFIQAMVHLPVFKERSLLATKIVYECIDKNHSVETLPKFPNATNPDEISETLRKCTMHKLIVETAHLDQSPFAFTQRSRATKVCTSFLLDQITTNGHNVIFQ